VYELENEFIDAMNEGHTMNDYKLYGKIMWYIKDDG
jgi:hypothetical protein